MNHIPLRNIPAQKCDVILAGQNCQLRVWQKHNGLYLDLLKNHMAIALGVLCRDRVWLIRESCRGFNGDLFFEDTLGKSDPNYQGLDGRFRLLYKVSS